MEKNPIGFFKKFGKNSQKSSIELKIPRLPQNLKNRMGLKIPELPKNLKKYAKLIKIIRKKIVFKLKKKNKK